MSEVEAARAALLRAEADLAAHGTRLAAAAGNAGMIAVLSNATPAKEGAVRMAKDRLAALTGTPPSGDAAASWDRVGRKAYGTKWRDIGA